MRKFNMFLLSGLLLAACNTGLNPTNEDNTEPVVGKRKRVEEKEEANAVGYKRERIDSDIVGILSKKLNEEKSIVENLTPCSAERQEEQLLERNGFVFYERELPDEVMLEVFRRLSVPAIAQASGICRGWYGLSEEPHLWKAVRLSIHGDYLENQATRENAKLHWLRVHVNTLAEPDKIEYLVTKYQLNKEHPFSKYRELDLFNTEENIDERAAQGDQEALTQKLDRLDSLFYAGKLSAQMVGLIDRLAEEGHETALYMKIQSLTTKHVPYIQAAANDLIKHLVEQGHEGAIQYKNSRDAKRLPLKSGKYVSKGIRCVCKDGVSIDFDGAIHFIDNLVKQGHEGAIQWEREIWDGYKKSRQAAVDLIERLAEQGKEEAIKLKISGLDQGDYGYEEDKEAAIAFNERLVEQGNEAAIERKIEGLAGIMSDEEPGGYGYEYDEDQENVYNLNEHLVKQGNIAAIKRKIKGLADDRREDGRYGYEEDQEAAVALNDHLVEQGNQWAIKRKIAGLYNGEYGYDKERTAAIALQQRLIEQGNEAVIRQKISSLADYNVPYKLDYDSGENLLFLLKSWLEEEEDKGKRWAYYLKAQGLKYGVLGFEKDREAAIQYILKYGIPY